jgi:glycosyltransferase involved in cell wall biosynthesis
VVALDGHATWRELVEEGAVRLVAPDAAELAVALRELLADGAARAALGARGRAFYEQRMSVELTARSLRALLDGALARR